MVLQSKIGLIRIVIMIFFRHIIIVTICFISLRTQAAGGDGLTFGVGYGISWLNRPGNIQAFGALKNWQGYGSVKPINLSGPLTGLNWKIGFEEDDFGMEFLLSRKEIRSVSEYESAEGLSSMEVRYRCKSLNWGAYFMPDESFKIGLSLDMGSARLQLRNGLKESLKDEEFQSDGTVFFGSSIFAELRLMKVIFIRPYIGFDFVKGYVGVEGKSILDYQDVSTNFRTMGVTIFIGL